MAYLGITASMAGLSTAPPTGDLPAALAERLRALPPKAPIVILVHGYKFNPGVPGTDPHRSLFAFRPDRGSWKVRSWPRGLGFAADAGETGLCLGFAWPASAPHLASLATEGRTGFAKVYDRAADYGTRLAELATRVQRLAPGREVDVLAHSLGARVVLSALPQLEVPLGRLILLGAAEFAARALEAVDALRPEDRPQIYNVTARANDLYDAMFEAFAPRRSWHDRAIGHGLGDARSCWLDLQLDRAAVTAWINERGIPLDSAPSRLCHWSFYTRPGALEVYRAILRRLPGWDIASLRAVPAFAAQEPRWSRLRPRLPRPLPGPLGLASDLRRA